MRPHSTVLAGVLCISVAFGVSSCADSKDNSAVVLDNCGRNVDVPNAPERVVTLGPESITTLENLDVLDRVVATAGTYPREYFDAQTQKKLDSIDTIPATPDDIHSVNADMVFGQSQQVTYESMEDKGVKVIDEPAYCGTLPGPASFQDVWNHVGMYGLVFGKEDEARAYNDELTAKLNEVSVPPSENPMSAAVVWLGNNGKTLYAYGNMSMANPVVGAAGLRNVFDDVNDRVFQISPSELAQRNPDVIVSLFTDGTADAALRTTRSFLGGSGIAAAQNNRIMPLRQLYAEPPNPLAVQGVEKIAAYVRNLS